MKRKRIEIPTLLRAGGFKKTEIKPDELHQNDCSYGNTRFEGLRIPKGSSVIRNNSGYKPRSHQKSIRELHMPQKDKTSTKENLSLHCVQDGQKEGRENSETFQEIPVQCRNSSEVYGEEHPFVE